MTELLYLRDSYLKDFEATVINVEGNCVFLDKTAFYPEGGGQQTDLGKLVRVTDGAVFNVIMVKKIGANISHEVDTGGLKIGDKVHGWIDWERRYKFMRAHTASHLLAAVIHNETGALITGNQLKNSDLSHLDFSGEIGKEMCPIFEQKTNELLCKNLEVTTKFLPYAEAMKIPSVVKLAHVLPPNIPELRIVSIGDVDIQADGGTHVKNTQECGQIKIINFENKGKDRKRIYFTLK